MVAVTSYRHTGGHIKRSRAKPAGPALAGEVSCERREVGNACSLQRTVALPVSRVRSSLSMFVVGLAIIFALLDSLSQTICGNARFVAV